MKLKLIKNEQRSDPEISGANGNSKLFDLLLASEVRKVNIFFSFFSTSVLDNLTSGKEIIS